MTSGAATATAAAATRLLNIGNLSGAERLLKEALAADPEHPRAHALMALLFYHRGQLWQAVRQAEVAIGLQPSSEAFRFKALALIKLKRGKAAIEAAEAAIRADPQCAMAMTVLASALENAKRLKDAKTAFQRAVELEPGSDVFRANFGRFLLRRRDVGGAERVAAELDPASDADVAQLLLGELALVRRRPQEARDRALWLLSRNATDPAALRLLTQVKASQSAFLGLWWRYAMFLALRPLWLRLLVFVPIILVFALATGGFGLLIFVYLAASGSIFKKMLAKELRMVQLRKSF
jgi:tetratricopeptide (TPR) repeat protein